MCLVWAFMFKKKNTQVCFNLLFANVQNKIWNCSELCGERQGKIVENDRPSSSLFETGIILLTFYGNINSFKNHE